MTPRWALDRAAEVLPCVFVSGSTTSCGSPQCYHCKIRPAVAQALAEVAEECVRIVSDGCIARTKFGSTTCRCQWCIQCEVMGNRILAEFEKDPTDA